jgi:hypothetical protein
MLPRHRVPQTSGRGRRRRLPATLAVVPAAEPTPKLPFWIHQIVEYGLGLMVMFQAIHAEDKLVPVIAGLVVMLIAATADGPAAAFPLVPRPVHRVLDIVVVVLAVAATVLPSSADSTARFLFALVAVALAMLVWRTNYRPKPPRRRRVAPQGPPLSRGAKAEQYGRIAGRIVGRSVRNYRDRQREP